MTAFRSDGPFPPPTRQDGCPELAGRFGSLDAFWRLIEPVLTHLQPRRVCEIGVEKGIFTSRLLAWGRTHGCAYVGIDPAPAPAAADRIQEPQTLPEGRAADQWLAAPSLEVLPNLERCGVYFVDGDHNYHTVRHELEMIASAPARDARDAAPPVIFVHDVSWPFARRDMYHHPDAIPPGERHPYCDDLGVSLETDELIAGGLRSPGEYVIARQAGGPRNGVLTAVEDFLAGETGRGWQAIVIPIGYGLAVLYRPEDPALPASCRDYLNDLRAAVEITGGFFESCEANFLQLYLYCEHVKYHLDEQTRAVKHEQGAHFYTLEAYKALEAAYADLAGAYQVLDDTHQNASIYNEAAMREYHDLQIAHTALENENQTLRARCDALQSHVDRHALSPLPPLDQEGSPLADPARSCPGE